MPRTMLETLQLQVAPCAAMTADLCFSPDFGSWNLGTYFVANWI
jgi:hypothetical protein